MRVVFLLPIGLYYGHFSHSVRTDAHAGCARRTTQLAKTESLNILSHELKTPLTVMAGYTQKLKSSALGEINPLRWCDPIQELKPS